MNTTKSSLDSENIKKIAPIAVLIGVVLGLLISFGIYLGGLWTAILILAWGFCGVLYSNTIIKTGGASDVTTLALNGAVLAVISELAYDVSSWIFMSFAGSPLTVGLILEALIVGALSAVFWHTLQTSNKK